MYTSLESFFLSCNEKSLEQVHIVLEGAMIETPSGIYSMIIPTDTNVLFSVKSIIKHVLLTMLFAKDSLFFKN